MQINNPSFNTARRRKKRKSPTNDLVIRFRLLPFKKNNKDTLKKSYNRMKGPSDSQMFHWKYNKNGILSPQLSKNTNEISRSSTLNELNPRNCSMDASMNFKHRLNSATAFMDNLHLAPFEDEEVKKVRHTQLPSLNQILEKYGIHLNLKKFKVI